MRENGFLLLCCLSEKKGTFRITLLREKPFLLSQQQKTKLFCNMTVYENTYFYLYLSFYAGRILKSLRCRV